MKKRKTQKITAFLLLLSLAVLAGCSQFPQPGQAAQPTSPPPVVTELPYVVAEGRIIPGESVWLSFEQPGRVEEVFVEEGETVRTGDVLARTGNREQIEAELRAAEMAELEAQQSLDALNHTAAISRSQAEQVLIAARMALVDARQALSDLDTEDYRDEIDDAWMAVQDAEDELEDAEDEFERHENLADDNPDRVQAEDELEEAQDAYDEAVRAHERLVNDLAMARSDVTRMEAEVEEAQRTYDMQIDGPDPDDLALAQARLDNARAQITAAESALENLTLAAPFDGTVTQVRIHEGEMANPSLYVIQVADFGQWEVETTDLTELEVVEINASRPVIVIPDAIPELELEGRVKSISEYATERSGDVIYIARIILEDTDPRLRWGMTVEVHFER